MNTASQIIAQRAPPAAIRTKSRWQPYNSMPQALRSPTASCLNTPLSLVPPQSQDCRPSGLSTKQSLQPQLTQTPISQTPKDPTVRDASKHKFAAGLIDQAVNILTEIWRPHDVPDVFKAPSKGPSPSSALGTSISLSAQQSFSSITTPLNPSLNVSFSQSSPSLLASASETKNNLLPMKTFVHEVLKRSRTSGSTLQAALCYLEAIRAKVPEILQQEKMGIRAQFHSETQILPATEAELARETELSALENIFDIPSIEQLQQNEMKTVRVNDGDNDDFDIMQHTLESDSASISSLIVEPAAPVETSSKATSAPSLPSPLLCPRRAFLASLILATKFFQDKCYSNRAWAKLSGLPPREIGRCERALGQALEWRLWVGKSAIHSFPSRTVVRSQSDTFPLSTSSANQVKPISEPRALRKCATMPMEGFSSQHSVISSVKSYQEQMPYGASIVEPRLPTCTTSYGPPPQYTEKPISSTPSPETPGLTYSPSSTDSSGDRTIQMPTFEETSFPSFSGSQPWMDVSLGPARSAINAFISGGNTKYNSTISGLQLGFDGGLSCTSKPQISIAGSEAEGYAPGHYLWHAGIQCASMETTSVH